MRRPIQPMVATLEEFTKADQPKTRCFVCNMPEREEIEAGRAKGITIPSIRNWLVAECGYDPRDLKDERLRKHWRAGHAGC
jgi:hypothetical protein